MRYVLEEAIIGLFVDFLVYRCRRLGLISLVEGFLADQPRFNLGLPHFIRNQASEGQIGIHLFNTYFSDLPSVTRDHQKRPPPDVTYISCTPQTDYPHPGLWDRPWSDLRTSPLHLPSIAMNTTPPLPAQPHLAKFTQFRS